MTSRSFSTLDLQDSSESKSDYLISLPNTLHTSGNHCLESSLWTWPHQHPSLFQAHSWLYFQRPTTLNSGDPVHTTRFSPLQASGCASPLLGTPVLLTPPQPCSAVKDLGHESLLQEVFLVPSPCLSGLTGSPVSSHRTLHLCDHRAIPLDPERCSWYSGESSGPCRPAATPSVTSCRLGGNISCPWC